jgi:hypothetical protein
VKANSKFFRKIGALKVYGDVARYYLSLAQFIVLIIVSGKLFELGIMVTLLLLLGFFIVVIVIVFFHVRYILPNEIRYLNERNPATMQLLKNTGDGKIEY